jgi:hypothetical protein
MFSYILPFALFSFCVVHQLALSDGASSEAPAELSSASTAHATAAAPPQLTTARTPAPIVETDITITGTVGGTTYVGSSLTCTATSDPLPDSYEWTRGSDTTILSNETTVLLTEVGQFTYNCTVYQHTADGAPHSASKTQSVNVQQAADATTEKPANETTAKHSGGLAVAPGACSWLVLITAVALQSLAIPSMA